MAAGDEAANPPPRVETDGTRIVREEARHVVDAQLRTLRATDRKAMATARVVAVVLGLLLSAASLAEDPSSAINRWLVTGSGLLLGSLGGAVLTYSVDRPSYGVGPGYLDDLSADVPADSELARDLLSRYADWIADNGDEISSNGTYLLASQALLVLGLVSVGLGLYQFL